MSRGLRFDLQSHSRCSDGSLAPAEVVTRAAAAGVELLALTDHDTVAGVTEALAAGARAGVAVVSAVEISVREAGRDLHLLGYRITCEDPNLQELLDRSRMARVRRAEAVVTALKELGWAVDERAVAERLAGGLAVGRPHLAHAVVSHAGNARRMRDEGLHHADAFLEAYLVPGTPAFHPRQSPTGREAISVIHGAGGVAVWAHPFDETSDVAKTRAMLDRLASAGLDGIECFYISHTREQTELLADEAAVRGLLSTGSADFHGPEHPRFSRFLTFDTYGRAPALGPILRG